MSPAPIALLMVAVLTIGFEALIYGNDLIEESIFTTLAYGDCSETGPLKTIACVVLNFFKFIINIIIVIASVLRFFYNALSFNIPGAPPLARLLVGSFFIGGIGWSIASLLRGTKA